MSKSRSKKRQGESRLSLTELLFYSSPYVIVIWLAAPVPILQGIYAKYYGFSLTQLASIVLFARIFDAITDPLIGYYSDRFYFRYGTRKPFIVAGGLLLIISSYCLYVPVEWTADNIPYMSEKVSVPYFTIWFMSLYFAVTLFEIPHSAWASELASTSEEKAKIFSFRIIAGSLGMMCFYLVPMLPIFDTQDVTPETLKLSVTSAGFLMIPLLFLCIKFTPNQQFLKELSPRNNINFQIVFKNKILSRSFFRKFTENKPLLIFFGAFLAYGLAVGMWFSLIFIYVDSYLGLGEYFAKTFLISFVISILATPVWCKLAIIFGKKAIISVGIGFLMISFIYAATLDREIVGFWQLLILQAVNTVGANCVMTFAPAMLSEIIDFGILKYRARNTGTYYAIFMFLTKFNLAVGGALGLSITGWYGLDVMTTDQTSKGIAGLLISIAGLPVIFVIIALALVILSPINTRRHNVIRRRLDDLAERERS